MKKNLNVSECDISTENDSNCGNCWGHQEYNNQNIDNQVDVSKRNKDGFILKFVKKHFV